MLRKYSIQMKIIISLLLLKFSNTLNNHLEFDDNESSGDGMILLDIKLNAIERKLEALISASGEQQKRLEDMETSKMPEIPILDTCNHHSMIHRNKLESKCSSDRIPENCYQINECNNHVYNIQIPNYSDKAFPVACDLNTANGGWTIIQRRQDGSVNFYRNWTEYVEGFGDLNGEFFIGLEKLHALTMLEEPQELYIILEDFEGLRRYALYKSFKVDSNATDYKLSVAEFSGTVGDDLRYHSGQAFSTLDRDNDASVNNCALKFKGAWWFKDCYDSHLNGEFLMGKLPPSKKGHGIIWTDFRGKDYSLKYVQMMIRPKQD